MRAVVQRVQNAVVEVEGRASGSILHGLLVYLGVGKNDTERDAEYICEKIVGLRIFEDDAGKMNLSLRERRASILVVSQFTLYGDCRRGKRPSFSEAAPPALANHLYEYFVERCRIQGIQIATGVFQAMMLVKSVNDGPVTILLDSEKVF
jgi:D-tyrosyl-tRNA(Tyr) deacylase